MHDVVMRLFAQEFESMLEEMPFDKIRVTNLSRRCGLSPQAFYYHFYDKYDLCAWIFLKDVSEAGDISNQSNLTSLLSRMRERRTLYARLLSQRSQNSLTDYLTNFYAQHASNPLTPEQNMAVWYNMHGFVGLVTKWLKSELPVSAEELGTFLFRVTPAFLLAGFAKQTPELLKTTSKSERQKHA